MARRTLRRKMAGRRRRVGLSEVDVIRSATLRSPIASFIIGWEMGNERNDRTLRKKQLSPMSELIEGDRARPTLPLKGTSAGATWGATEDGKGGPELVTKEGELRKLVSGDKGSLSING